MEGQGEKAVWTESLKATIFANSKGCGATAVVVNQGLAAMFEVSLDFFE